LLNGVPTALLIPVRVVGMEQACALGNWLANQFRERTRQQHSALLGLVFNVEVNLCCGAVLGDLLAV
jgi:hypothetical protein